MYAEGVVIGHRYRLVRQLGEGGMATVWEAVHEHLESPVAIKFLHAATDGSHGRELSERFMREARAAASVRHRNVIEITDFGITDDGVPYMVMEKLEGESLAERMERTMPFDIAESARLIALVLRGLRSVHDVGLVHRDLKPENIFLAEDEDGTFPKLLDFGVSRHIGAMSTKLTQEGGLVGTPDYMSPEQARGLRDIDSRTDLYSMGVILYEMLTGRLPFESDNVGDLIVMITTQDPPPVTELRPEISPALADVVHRAMQRDPGRRFTDAREMRQALLDAVGLDPGFGEHGTGLVSISDIPMPTESAQRASEQSLPTPQPLPADEPDPSAHQTRNAAPPSDAEAPTDGARSSGRSPAPLITTIALLLLGAVGGILAYRQYVGAPAVSAPPPEEASRDTKPPGTPWKPRSPGLPRGLVDAGPPRDAGSKVVVELTSVPEGGTIEVAGVTVADSPIRLPAKSGSYEVTVRLPDAGTVWRTRHPGDVAGTYQVWRMTPEQLRQLDSDDAGRPLR